MLAIERPASIKELMLAAEFREAEVLSNDSCSNTTGMWILGGFPPERRSKWARGCGQLSPPHPLSLTLCFINHHCETAESSYSTGARLSQGTRLAMGYLCSGSIPELRLKKPLGPPYGGQAESQLPPGSTAKREEACLLRWLLRQSGEKKCVHGSGSSLSLLPISLLAPCLPWVPGTLRNSVNSETPPAWRTKVVH